MTESDRDQRIVITIDSTAFTDTTLDYAVTVAARMKRPIHGIFIEDTDLLSSAELPFTTEICSSTGTPQHFDSGSLRSAFDELLARFQQRLAQRAEPLSVRWSVSAVRGRRRDFVFEHLAETDYCIYDSASRGRPAATRASRHLLVIDGEDENFYRSLAALVAPLEGYELHITLVRTAGLESPGDEALLATLPAGTHLHTLSKQQLAATLKGAGDPFDYVVVSRRRWHSELAPQLAQLHCPLILVG